MTILPQCRTGGQSERTRRWQDDGAMTPADEWAKKLYFQCAREQMAPYQHVMRTFSGAVEVFPGVASAPLHGRTPDHSGYMIASGGQSLLIRGDIVHAPEVQVPRPDLTMAFDTDPHAAAATRKRGPSTW
jgi:glyoxylase-like metal-dependent hydrolase (beta-lactamase superfamily II)